MPQRKNGWPSVIALLMSWLMCVSRWLYTQNLTIDADFRLKNKDCGVKNDPPLGDGWGHWVPEKPYQDYIQKYGYQTEVWFSLRR
jgi:hypothetical protein